MNATLDRLDADTHARILEGGIIPKSGINEALSHERPKAIILGGQPGAGKGGLVRTTKAELAFDVVPIDPDALRDFHPDVARFRSETPYTWSGRTHADASAWADELLEATVKGRKNLIFDTTLSNGEWAAGLIDDLQAKGYDVEVRAIAAHRLESELGVEKRFTEKLDLEGHARYVPASARDAIYGKLGASLDTIHASTGVPIRIFDREGTELYDSRTDPRAPGVALEQGREARAQSPDITRRLRDGWREQVDWHRDLPDRLAANPRVAPDVAGRVLQQRAGEGVEARVADTARQAFELDHRVRIVPTRLRAGTALGVAGLALDLLDAAQTQHAARSLRGRGNDTAADSQVLHYGARTLGGFAGAGAGFVAGAAAGAETGPGLLLAGTIGGIAGAVAGDELAAWMDHRAIYNQTDRQGHTWTFDPERPDLGWRRRAPVDGTQDGVDNARRESLRASPLLEAELDFQAARTSVGLVLGSPPVPRDPFSQAAGEGDTPGVSAAPWVRTEAGHWERTVMLGYAERGLAPTRTERATPERAAELEQAAARTVLENSERAAPAIAARFEATYRQNGWARFGPLPEAVRHARDDIDTLVASDGRTYSRRGAGEWISDGLLTDSRARGRLHEELEATRTVLAARLSPGQEIPMPAPVTEAERLRDVVAGAYRNAGIELGAGVLDERAAAVARTWREHGLDAQTTALRVSAAGGPIGADSPLESLRLDADGRTYRLAATTYPDAMRERTGEPPVPEPAGPRDAPAPSRGARVERLRAEQETADRPARPLLADDPSHPGHATFQRIHDWVRGTGHWDDEKSRNIAAALYREQVSNPLVRRVDQVTGGLGRDGAENVFAIYAPYGEREPRFHVQVDGRIASHQPAQQSLQQADELERRMNLQTQEQALQKAMEPAGQAMAR